MKQSKKEQLRYLSIEQINGLAITLNNTLKSRWDKGDHVQTVTHEEITKLINQYNFGMIDYDTPSEAYLLLYQKKENGRINRAKPIIIYYTNIKGMTLINTSENDRAITDKVINGADAGKITLTIFNCLEADAKQFKKEIDKYNDRLMLDVTDATPEKLEEIAKIIEQYGK